MRPRERRETGELDLFRARLDQIIDLDHALVKLAKTIDWRFLEDKLGVVYSDGPGNPPLATRLMAGLAILKHSYDLADEALCERWVENPYFQYFCGEEFFQHRLVFDRSSLTRWRQRMGEEKLAALLQESLAVAARTKALKPSDLARVVVDTTVQPKAVMFPSDAKLVNRARECLVRQAQKRGVRLRRECPEFCVRDFCEGGFGFWFIESVASAARSATLLGAPERSSPEAAQRRAVGAGLDGEGADQAIIAPAAMSSAAIIASFLESARRIESRTGSWRKSIRPRAASACRRS